MTTKDDGGPFHPYIGFNDGAHYPGASYREWLAGIAMLANRLTHRDMPPESVARMACWDTDALIAELKKCPTTN